VLRAPLSLSYNYLCSRCISLRETDMKMVVVMVKCQIEFNSNCHLVLNNDAKNMVEVGLKGRPISNCIPLCVSSNFLIEETALQSAHSDGRCNR
jgi:hypothetical protein